MLVSASRYSSNCSSSATTCMSRPGSSALDRGGRRTRARPRRTRRTRPASAGRTAGCARRGRGHPPRSRRRGHRLVPAASRCGLNCKRPSSNSSARKWRLSQNCSRRSRRCPYGDGAGACPAEVRQRHPRDVVVDVLITVPATKVGHGGEIDPDQEADPGRRARPAATADWGWRRAGRCPAARRDRYVGAATTTRAARWRG